MKKVKAHANKNKFNATTLKMNLKLTQQRIKTLVAKKNNLNSIQRKETAQLLKDGKEVSAVARVETVIRTDYLIEALEGIDAFCQQLLDRFSIVEGRKYIDESVTEAVCTVMWSAPRLPADVKEIHVVREQLVFKYGKEVGIQAMENQDDCVNAKIVKRLDLTAPSEKLKFAYLEMIAESHGVAWSAPEAPAPKPKPAPPTETIRPSVRRSPGPQEEKDESGQSGIVYETSTFQSFLNKQSAAYQQETNTAQHDVDDELRNLPTPPTNTTAAPNNASEDDDDDGDFAELNKRFNSSSHVPPSDDTLPPPPPPPMDSDDDSDSDFGELADRFKKLQS